MKYTKTLFSLIAAALLLSISWHKAGAQNTLADRIQKVNSQISQRPVEVQVVILEIEESVSYGPTYHGLLVYNSSSSAGAPTFPHYPEPEVSAADAVAQLLAAGFEEVRPNMFVKRIVR